MRALITQTLAISAVSFAAASSAADMIDRAASSGMISETVLPLIYNLNPTHLPSRRFGRRCPNAKLEPNLL